MSINAITPTDASHAACWRLQEILDPEIVSVETAYREIVKRPPGRPGRGVARSAAFGHVITSDLMRLHGARAYADDIYEMNLNPEEFGPDMLPVEPK
ncbi:MAG: hypothetical protein JWL85_782, partial [Candidatus Saccharibacteria bacterium]|nr:hypothetical protein [Candidatus Saccharibacteria bacterium]